jgi:hypothetical protein
MIGLEIGFSEHSQIVTTSTALSLVCMRCSWLQHVLRASRYAVFACHCLVAEPNKALCFRAHDLTDSRLSHK